jgi:hypothetical protein
MSRQLAAPAAKLSALMNNKTQSSSGQHGQQASGQIQSGRLLRLGLDVHYRQVTVALQEDGGGIQVAGKMG